MPSRDYSDSEDDLESRDPIDTLEHEAAPKEGEASSKPTSSSLRIKLRPARLPSHERSSLSPPPPLTLKFGLPPSAPSTSRPSKAERAAYSSSEDDEAGPSAPAAKPSSKPKKPRVSRAKKRQLEETAALEPPVGQAAGRKSYDWLIPSFAGASHAGPVARDTQEPAKKVPRLSEYNELEEQPMAINPAPIPEKESKRSHKKKRESDVVGPGKAWRKGIKKGVMRPPRDTGIETPAGSTPGNSRPGSPEGTPEEEEARHIDIQVEHMATPDGPFVLADPDKLNMPVFSKPIVAPKMILSQFPKVTPYFLPNNGGDSGPFPRKEKTRSWKNSEREFVGIGGGTLKFKSWVKGPPGDLTNVLKAEKDLQDLRAKANKESTDSKPKANKDGVEIKPKAPKEKDESKPKAPKDEKPKQPRTIAIAPRPRANSGSDATPPTQFNSTMNDPAHFNLVHLKETSSGPIALSPLPEFNRELPAIPSMQGEGSFRPSVLEPVTPSAAQPSPNPGAEASVFQSAVPSGQPSMLDLSDPSWTSNGAGLSRWADGVKHSPTPYEKPPPVHVRGSPRTTPKSPKSLHKSPKSSSKPLFTTEPLASPSPASGSQSADVDMIEPGSAKAPRKSKLALEIRIEANAEQ